MALSSGKIHKDEYLTGEDILSSNQRQIIEQTEFTGKSFWKTNKNNWRSREKQVKALKTKAIADKLIITHQLAKKFTIKY